MNRSFLIWVFLLLIFSSNLFSGVLHFEHADVVYPEGYEENAKLVGKIFENIRQQVIDLIGNDPGRITIVLEDKGTISNGYTMPLFHRTITLYMWPPESWIAFELPLEDWYTYLIIHEFTHMVHLTYQDIFTKIFSILTGFPYLPQLYGPFVEGTTVFAESSFSKNSGRLNNPYVSDGLYYYSIQNFPSFTYKELMPWDDYRGGQLYYNYTAGFYKYLVDTYGIEKVKKYIELTSTIIPDFEVGTKYKDVFEKVFGKPFDELYTDWIRSLMKLNYTEGSLVYKAPNSKIYKLDLVDGKLAVYLNEYGPATSYIGTVNPRLIVIDKKGKIQSSKNLIAVDIKYVDKTTYVLTKAESFGNYENQIWDISSGKLLATGKISAFAIDKGKLYTARYDTRKMQTTIRAEGFDITLDKYVAYMDAKDGKLAILTSDYQIIVYDTLSKERIVIDDDAMKGPYLRFWNNGLIFTRVDGKYVNPYYYDLLESKLYKLGEDMLVYDFYIDGEDIYYVSYIPYSLNTGTGVYKVKVSKDSAELVKREFKFEFTEKQFKYGSELTFRLQKMMQPLTWIPMYEYGYETDAEVHRAYMIFTFGNVENDSFLILTPIFDLRMSEYDYSVDYSQYIAWYTSKDFYETFASYFYPTNDYNLSGVFRLGGFTLSPITDLYGYLTFSFKTQNIGLIDSLFSLFTVNVPTVLKNNVGLGALITSYAFGFPYKAQLFMLLSNDKIEDLFNSNNLLSNLYGYGYLGLALTNDVTFEGRLATKLSSIDKTSYDMSLASTLFTDNAFLFGNLLYVRNSGITVGVMNPSTEGLLSAGIYTHFFVETYVQGLKVYPSVGMFVPFSEMTKPVDENQQYIFYIGLNSSPHGFPVPLLSFVLETGNQ